MPIQMSNPKLTSAINAVRELLDVLKEQQGKAINYQVIDSVWQHAGNRLDALLSMNEPAFDQRQYRSISPTMPTSAAGLPGLPYTAAVTRSTLPPRSPGRSMLPDSMVPQMLALQPGTVLAALPLLPGSFAARSTLPLSPASPTFGTPLSMMNSPSPLTLGTPASMPAISPIGLAAMGMGSPSTLPVSPRRMSSPVLAATILRQNGLMSTQMTQPQQLRLPTLPAELAGAPTFANYALPTISSPASSIGTLSPFQQLSSISPSSIAGLPLGLPGF